MFRSFLGEENLCGGKSLTSEAVQGLPSSCLRSKESPWISVLSRPPLLFLHKYVRGRPRTPALCDDWASSMKTTFLSDENAFLLQLDGMIPHSSSNLTHLQCLFNGATAANTSLLQGTGELGPEVCRDQRSKRSFSRTIFSRAWSTSQEINLAALRPLFTETRAGGARWWNHSWGGSGVLSDVSHIQDGNLTAPPSKTKASAVFIQSRWILGESAGLSNYKGEKFNTGALQTAQTMEGDMLNHHQSRSGSGTLDQDNGYSNLEEELFQVSCLHMLTEPLVAPAEAENLTVKSIQEQEDTSEDAAPLMGEENKNRRLDKTAQGECDSLTLPKCQNKVIASIMGCPCSDDEDDGSSQSDGESSDDDDGFDSEGSSSLSESSEDESSDSEVELDTEHLWRSLCHSMDPYNPLNFMAQLQTRPLPETITIPSPPQSTLNTLPCLTSLPESQPPSDSWDDSASTSDADEAESLRLWTSFSTCLDPYSPLNFQATLRTREPDRAGTGSRSREASHAHTSPSQKDEPAERMDSDLKDLRQSRKTIKKVSEPERDTILKNSAATW